MANICSYNVMIVYKPKMGQPMDVTDHLFADIRRILAGEDNTYYAASYSCIYDGAKFVKSIETGETLLVGSLMGESKWTATSLFTGEHDGREDKEGRTQTSLKELSQKFDFGFQLWECEPSEDWYWLRAMNNQGTIIMDSRLSPGYEWYWKEPDELYKF